MNIQSIVGTTLSDAAIGFMSFTVMASPSSFSLMGASIVPANRTATAAALLTSLIVGGVSYEMNRPVLSAPNTRREGAINISKDILSTGIGTFIAVSASLKDTSAGWGGVVAGLGVATVLSLSIGLGYYFYSQ